MGQGRHIRTAIRCILLVVATIQGITPDAHDLASPLAMTLVVPQPIGWPDLIDDDPSPTGPCAAIRETLPWPSHHQEHLLQTMDPRLVDRAMRSIAGQLDPRSRPLCAELLSRDISLTLCRLVC